MPTEKPIYRQCVGELVAALGAGNLTAVTILEALIGRTKELDPELHAFLSVDVEDSLRQASASDRRRMEGRLLGPLDGIPVAIKDIIAEKGRPLTCGSRILGNYVSPYDATVIRRLRTSGLVLWGRTNLDEFAMGSSTESSAFGATKNPWDRTRVPGGSSGGSACCVAAGFAPLALGTDTGGSIRQPAAFCGITGLKPTYGCVSRYGVSAFASSLEQVGPFGRSVEDVALLLSSIAGHDPMDSTSVAMDTSDYLAASRKFRTWTIGVPEEFFKSGLDGEVEAAVRRAIAFYEKSGCRIRTISLPDPSLAIAVYYIICTAEAFSNLSRFDGIRYGLRFPKARDAVDVYFQSRGAGFGEEVKRRILLGAFVLSDGYQNAYYTRAQRIRTRFRRDYLNILTEVDGILTPTTPAAAFPLGGRVQDPLAMYLADIYTVTANLVGLPAISIPCGFTASRLPIGLQIIAKPFAEREILAMANSFQLAHDFHCRDPLPVGRK